MLINLLTDYLRALCTLNISNFLKKLKGFYFIVQLLIIAQNRNITLQRAGVFLLVFFLE